MAHSHSFTILRATGSDVTFDRVRAGNVSFKFKIQETAPLRALEIVVRPVCGERQGWAASASNEIEVKKR